MYLVILIYGRPLVIVPEERQFFYMEKRQQVIGASYLHSFKLNLANLTFASLCFYEIDCIFADVETWALDSCSVAICHPKVATEDRRLGDVTKMMA